MDFILPDNIGDWATLEFFPRRSDYIPLYKVLNYCMSICLIVSLALY